VSHRTFLWYNNPAVLVKQHVFLGAFAKLWKATISFVMSVSPHGTTRLPLDGFSWNLIIGDFSKICHENSSFIKIGPELRVIYRKINVHILSFLAHFFLEWETFRSKVVEKLEMHILCPATFFLRSCSLWDNVEEFCRVGQATGGNMARAHCMLTTQG